MAENCNSNPTSGCEDSQTFTDLSTLTDLLDIKLTSIISKKQEIIGVIDDCNEANNAKFQLIIDVLQDILDQGEECCEETLTNLRNIVRLLTNIVIGEQTTTTTSTTIHPGSTTTTTTANPAITTTTTTSGPTTTTTTVLEDEEADFIVSNGIGLVCLTLPVSHLYYHGVFGPGVTMYTYVVGGTKLTGYTFIRKTDEVFRYNLNSTYGLVGSKVSPDCDFV